MVVAERLGTTQAAVSNYLYAKRGDKIMKKLESVPSIRKAACEMAEGIATQQLSFVDALSKFCELCLAMRKSDIICELHHGQATLPEACNICPEVAFR
jgi:predicted transcriptional regulator